MISDGFFILDLHETISYQIQKNEVLNIKLKKKMVRSLELIKH